MEVQPLGINVSVMEPDYLDTGSLALSARIIDDYRETAGKVRTFVRAPNHALPGGAARLADALIELMDGGKAAYRPSCDRKSQPGVLSRQKPEPGAA